jgi:hypothetical protein
VWPLPEDLDDAQAGSATVPAGAGDRLGSASDPDWAWAHRELRRPDMTLALLWKESHIAGEKLFVDFAGRTGEKRNSVLVSLKRPPSWLKSTWASDFPRFFFGFRTPGCPGRESARGGQVYRRKCDGLSAYK